MLHFCDIIALLVTTHAVAYGFGCDRCESTTAMLEPRCRHDHSLFRPLRAASLLEPWQLRRIPSTADGFDEKDAGVHASPLNVDVISLICQQHRLRRDDLKIVVDAALVPIG